MALELPKEDILKRVLQTKLDIYPFRRNSSPGQVEIPTRLFDRLDGELLEISESLNEARVQLMDSSLEVSRNKMMISNLRGQVTKLRKKNESLREELKDSDLREHYLNQKLIESKELVENIA